MILFCRGVFRQRFSILPSDTIKPRRQNGTCIFASQALHCFSSGRFMKNWAALMKRFPREISRTTIIACAFVRRAGSCSSARIHLSSTITMALLLRVTRRACGSTCKNMRNCWNAISIISRRNGMSMTIIRRTGSQAFGVICRRGFLRLAAFSISTVPAVYPSFGCRRFFLRLKSAALRVIRGMLLSLRFLSPPRIAPRLRRESLHISRENMMSSCCMTAWMMCVTWKNSAKSSAVI